MSATIAILIIILFLSLGLILAFEIWMFIDAYKNSRLSSNEKILWMVGMVLIHPFVALGYYFVARKPRI